MFAPFPLQFSLNYKVSIEIQGLSSTGCNFHGLFKDFQGACEPCNLVTVAAKQLDTFLQTFVLIVSVSIGNLA